MFDTVVQYNFPTVIRFGAGAVKELPDYLVKNGIKSPLIVTDPVVAQLGFFKEIMASLQAKNLGVEVFSDIHKNPVKSDVYKGTDVYDATQRDGIVGIVRPTVTKVNVFMNADVQTAHNAVGRAEVAGRAKAADEVEEERECEVLGELHPGDVFGFSQRSVDSSYGRAQTIISNFVAPSSVAPSSAPAPLPLFGAAAAFGWSRQMRRRIKTPA
jgi:hypothetical protein